jgi:hypothetical protein
MSKFHFCMCNFQIFFIYNFFRYIYTYIFLIYMYKRVLRVLLSKSKFHVSNTCISVSSVSHVIVSGDLGQDKYHISVSMFDGPLDILYCSFVSIFV